VHAPFDSVKQYQLIPHNSLSHYQHCSDLWPLKVKRDRISVYYQITQLSEQRYAIPTGNKILKRQQCDVCHVVLML
jgi:hypothetical protein